MNVLNGGLSKKKNKYKQMIDVFNQHIYVQSRHFRTQKKREGKKNLKYIFFLSHVKITQNLSSRPWWDRFAFSFSLSPGRDNTIVQEFFSVLDENTLLYLRKKTDGRHFLPEHQPRRCSVTAQSCWSTVNAEMSLQTNLAQLKWGVNQRVCWVVCL